MAIFIGFCLVLFCTRGARAYDGDHVDDTRALIYLMEYGYVESAQWSSSLVTEEALKILGSYSKLRTFQPQPHPHHSSKVIIVIFIICLLPSVYPAGFPSIFILVLLAIFIACHRTNCVCL